MLHSPAFAMEAGAATVDITPPLGTPLNGYGDRLGRGATSVRDPLTARCLYLSDGETNLFFVTTDLCVVNRELREAVLQVAPTIVPPENIILTATHNHNGTGGMIEPVIFRTVSGPFNPEILDFTAERIARAMEIAFENRERATVAWGTTRQDVLSANRRFDDGPIDPQIGVIKVEDADGNPISIIGNFAAHPTTVPSEDRYAISADYCGFYYNHLEELAGEKCVAMFINGAEGNQSCGNPEGHDDPWDRTESIGRLLAVRVKEVANRLDGQEMTLNLATKWAELPPSIGDDWMPRETFLQVFEIDDLVMTFFPGEPTVEIGLELRRRAEAMGYRGQFSVGLANDHLLYFIPRSLYTEPIYETAMNLYGPRIEDWFYREFTSLMTRAPAPEMEPQRPVPEITDEGDILRITLTGSPYDMGWQRGRAFAGALQSAFDQYVRESVTDRTWLKDHVMTEFSPPFIDISPLGLPLLAMTSRPLLADYPESIFAELEGVAEGAHIPFDAAWLLQAMPTYAAAGDVTSILDAPLCTIFAVRSGEHILVGRNFDWNRADQVVITEVQPGDGRAYTAVGFPWHLGTFTAMNEAGLVVAVERVRGLGAPLVPGPFVELLLRQAVSEFDNARDAAGWLQEVTGLRGYAVMVADGNTAIALSYGPAVESREIEGDILTAVPPAASWADDEATQRYTRVTGLATAGMAPSEVMDVLADSHRGMATRASILNGDTRYAAVFDPEARRMLVATPSSDGGLTEPITVDVTPAGVEAAP